MDLKVGQKVVIVYESATFRCVYGMEGYIGIGRYTGNVTLSDGTVENRAWLDGTRYVLGMSENSNIKFYDPQEYIKVIEDARRDLESKLKYVNVTEYDVEQAIYDNKRKFK